MSKERPRRFVMDDFKISIPAPTLQYATDGVSWEMDLFSEVERRVSMIRVDTRTD